MKCTRSLSVGRRNSGESGNILVLPNLSTTVMKPDCISLLYSSSAGTGIDMYGVCGTSAM